MATAPGDSLLGVKVCPVRRVPYPNVRRWLRASMVFWALLQLALWLFVVPAHASLLVRLGVIAGCVAGGVLTGITIVNVMWRRWKRRHPITRTVLFEARQRYVAASRDNAWLN